jgi:hypothetical protein
MFCLIMGCATREKMRDRGNTEPPVDRERHMHHPARSAPTRTAACHGEALNGETQAGRIAPQRRGGEHRAYHPAELHNRPAEPPGHRSASTPSRVPLPSGAE